jgi:peptidyl-prolyl cis-trans isomerase A (cyclophilin A)
MTAEAIREMADWLDAANVDLKAWQDSFYRQVCKGRVEPVKESIRGMLEAGVHVEVTTLLVPRQNDAPEDLRGIAEFLAGLSPDLVWHVSRYHPDYRFDRAPVTPEETIFHALAMGRKAGLRYVYAGLFQDASFYRVVRMDNQPNNAVKIEVIQGGLEFSSGKREFPPIEHEATARTGILHKNGVISMARDKPGSATSEFFICVGDQPELDFGGKRNPDGQGFAAFGKVIDGMDVVKKTQEQPAQGQRLIHRVTIRDIVRVY